MISAVKNLLHLRRGIILFLLLIFCLNSCSEAPDKQHIKLFGATMGTVYSINVPNPPDGVNEDTLRSGVEAVLAGVNAKMSTYLKDSEISAFNQLDSKDWYEISDPLYEVVKIALSVSDKTGGAFDITVGPLVDLWGFGANSTMPETVPTDPEILDLANKIGYREIELREFPAAIRKKNPAINLDLSAIAKGYGVDLVADYFESLGIRNYLVEIGGEIRVEGSNANGGKWRIAIEKPLVQQRSAARVVSLNAGAIATSGDYRNFFEKDGQRFSHTIDPRSGKPVTHRLASVSVVSDTAVLADAMATALMVFGPDKGFQFARDNGLAAYFIIKTDRGFVEKKTDGFPS